MVDFENVCNVLYFCLGYVENWFATRWFWWYADCLFFDSCNELIQQLRLSMSYSGPPIIKLLVSTPPTRVLTFVDVNRPVLTTPTGVWFPTWPIHWRRCINLCGLPKKHLPNRGGYACRLLSVFGCRLSPTQGFPLFLREPVLSHACGKPVFAHANRAFASVADSTAEWPMCVAAPADAQGVPLERVCHDFVHGWQWR